MKSSVLPQLHFVHANSYPASTYRLYFQHLGAHYQIQALDRHGHDPAYPVENGWRKMLKELIHEIESRYDSPVILCGHSMGGMLGLMLAAKRPDLVRALVMLDSPVVAGWRASLVWLFQKTGLGAKYSPGRLSERRRAVWASRNEAHAHFLSKPVYARWDAEVLQDFVEWGLEAIDEGVQLRFSRDVETRIYDSMPYDLGRMTRRGLKVPAGFIAGTQSVECRMAGLRATKHLVGKHFMEIQGGHLFPMESPEKAALLTHRMIQQLV